MKQKTHAIATALSFFRQQSVKARPVYRSIQKLWQSYQAKFRQKQLANKRLLRQKALKKEMSPQSGQWTDRFLKIIAIKTCGALYPFRHLPFSGCLLLLLVVVTVHRSSGQVKDLRIGDKVPEAVWNTPLQVVNHPAGKTAITLSQYKGKLIILDFWATWCANCIEAFPVEDSLQKAFGGEVVILPVSTQKQSVITAFMQRDNPSKGTGLTVVTDDKLLSSTFKHRLLPHLAWIDGEGRFIASTASSYVQSEKIKQVLAGTPLNWNMKQDFMAFQKERPLMVLADNGGLPPKILGYSLFTQYLSGVDPVSGTQVNEAEHSQRRYDLNMPLGTFSIRAFEGVLPPLSKKQYIYEVMDVGKYRCPPGMLYIDWKVANTWCYEAVLPEEFSDFQVKQKMREDLKSYFGLEGKLENRKVTAWVFEKNGKAMQTPPAEKSISMGDLIWTLNEQHLELPMALDETGLQSLKIPTIDKGKLSIADLNAVLNPYGIKVTVTECQVPFFVLYEQNPATAKR